MLTPQTTAVKHTLRHKELIIQLTPSANYVAGGDNCHLDALTVAPGVSDGGIGWPSKITEYKVIQCPFGYKAELVKGSDLTSWKLRVELTGAALSAAYAELPAAAYPAGVLAGVFVISIIGPKGRI